MLKIKIESCPDDDLIGEHTYFFDALNFGSHQKNDFIIKSEGIPAMAISLRCQPQGIFVKTEQIDFFLSNGKKVKGEKVHKPGDKVEFLGTVFEIKEYDSKSIKTGVTKSELVDGTNELQGAAAQVASDIKKLLDNDDS